MFAVVFHTDDEITPSVIGPFESVESAKQAILTVKDYQSTVYWINIVEITNPASIGDEWDIINGKAFSEGIVI